MRQGCARDNVTIAHSAFKIRDSLNRQTRSRQSDRHLFGPLETMVPKRNALIRANRRMGANEKRRQSTRPDHQETRRLLRSQKACCQSRRRSRPPCGETGSVHATQRCTGCTVHQNICAVNTGQMPRPIARKDIDQFGAQIRMRRRRPRPGRHEQQSRIVIGTGDGVMMAQRHFDI